MAWHRLTAQYTFAQVWQGRMQTNFVSLRAWCWMRPLVNLCCVSRVDLVFLTTSVLVFSDPLVHRGRWAPLSVLDEWEDRDAAAIRCLACRQYLISSSEHNPVLVAAVQPVSTMRGQGLRSTCTLSTPATIVSRDGASTCRVDRKSPRKSSTELIRQVRFKLLLI